MTRGGKARDSRSPERRCLVTGDVSAKDRLIRFVLAPDGSVVPDLAGKLPGRGAWVTADRSLIDRAVKKRLFSRAFRQPVEAAEDLSDRIEALLTSRLNDLLGFARKAGQAVTGAEKVRARITSGKAAILLQASDGADGGRKKLAALANAAGAGAIERIELLSSTELGLAFGREFAIHAALDAGGFATRVSAEAGRLSGFRAVPASGDETYERPRHDQSGHASGGSRDFTQRAPNAGATEQDDA